VYVRPHCVLPSVALALCHMAPLLLLSRTSLLLGLLGDASGATLRAAATQSGEGCDQTPRGWGGGGTVNFDASSGGPQTGYCPSCMRAGP
jgi:hypothetical protein